MSSAIMLATHSASNFFPTNRRLGMFLEIGLSTSQLFLLPIVNWHFLGLRGKVVPQVFHQLQLFWWS